MATKPHTLAAQIKYTVEALEDDPRRPGFEVCGLMDAIRRSATELALCHPERPIEVIEYIANNQLFAKEFFSYLPMLIENHPDKSAAIARLCFNKFSYIQNFDYSAGQIFKAALLSVVMPKDSEERQKIVKAAQEANLSVKPAIGHQGFDAAFYYSAVMKDQYGEAREYLTLALPFLDTEDKAQAVMDVLDAIFVTKNKTAAGLKLFFTGMPDDQALMFFSNL